MNFRHARRILAVDLRPQKFGYAVFENQSKLIDWGIRGFTLSNLRIRMFKLMKTVEPAVVVVRRKSSGYRRRYADYRIAKQILYRTCKSASVSIVDFRSQTLKSFVRQYKTKNKYEMAALIGSKFPELSWQLPLYTKPWESEHWRMPIFDAALVGMAYLTLEEASNPFAGLSVA
jgi:hypothetical protein